MTKHILALSGGADSSAMLDYLTGKYPKKDILAQHCSCRHVKTAAKEEAAARAIAKHYKVKLQVDDAIYRHEKWAEIGTVTRYNLFSLQLILHVLDKGYENFTFYEAYNQTDIDNVGVPVTYDDHPHFCSTVDIVTKGKVKLVHPFRTILKSDIILDHPNTPWQHTWSCYGGEEHHCGVCGPCVRRKEAFIIAGVTDPAIPKEKREKWQ